MSAATPPAHRAAQPVTRKSGALRVAGAIAATALAFALYARVEWWWFGLGWVGLVPWLAVLERTSTLRRAILAGLLMSVAFVLAVFGWFAVAIANYTGAPLPVAVLIVILLAPVLQPQFLTYAAARRLIRSYGTGFLATAIVGASIYVGSEWAIPKLFGDTLGHGFYASALMRQSADLAGAAGLTFILIIANECVLAILMSILPPTRAPIPPFGEGGLGGISRSDDRRVRKIPPYPPSSKGGIGGGTKGGSGRETSIWIGRGRALVAPAACLLLLVLAPLAYGTLRLRQLRDEAGAARPVTAGIVQADISRYARLAADMGTFDAVRMILDHHFSLSAQALERERLDLLVWPETVYPTTFGSPKSADGAAFDREIAKFVNEAGVPLIFGAYDVADGREYNAAIFLEPSADSRLTFDAYRKTSLFPLTERVPAVLELDVVRRWLPWLGTWQPGEPSGVMSVTLPRGETLRVAPLICYDAVDPGIAIAAVRAGAELIVTLSNDSWFASGQGPHLHLVVSAFRSIETRRPQVRATNTGISAVFDATGEMIASVGVHERASLVARVTPRRGPSTLMLAWGDWFGPLALVVGIVLLGYVAFTARDGTAAVVRRSGKDAVGKLTRRR